MQVLPILRLQHFREVGQILLKSPKNIFYKSEKSFEKTGSYERAIWEEHLREPLAGHRRDLPDALLEHVEQRDDVFLRGAPLVSGPANGKTKKALDEV